MRGIFNFRIFLVGILLGGVASVAHAQEAPPPPGKRELAEKLLQLFQVGKSFDAVFEQGITAQIEHENEKVKLTKSQRERQQHIIVAAVKEMRRIFAWDKIKDSFIDVYANNFTEEDLNAMIEFFKSPVGHKFIETEPVIQDQLLEKMQTIIITAQPRIASAIQKATADVDGTSGFLPEPAGTLKPVVVTSPSPTATPGSTPEKKVKGKTRHHATPQPEEAPATKSKKKHSQDES
ncbi:MAG: DUF2059 domain-containing protein [Chthoniobacterales bacterium]